MSSEQIKTGAVEPIMVDVTDVSGSPLPGKADLFIRVRRNSDGWFLDWADNTFKASGWTTLNKLLTEVDATNVPGLYEVIGGLDTSAIFNPAASDTYVVSALQTPGTDAKLPAPGELKVGQLADDVAKIDSVATVGPAAAASGSLLDRVANKDSGKTYNQATDSLEAIKDRAG